MTFNLSARSLAKMEGVDPRLVRVVTRAILITPIDFLITCGVRTPAEQAILYAQGRTKPGNIVTYNRVSNHFVKPDGYGHAVDLVPFPVDWEGPVKFPKFEAIAAAMKEAARLEGVKIQWGGDWSKFRDRPHFELAR